MLNLKSIVSTPNDLLVFIDALFNDKLISNSSRKLMIIIENNYGLGIFIIFNIIESCN